LAADPDARRVRRGQAKKIRTPEPKMKKNLRAAAARTGEQPDLSEKKNGVQLRTRTAHK
jgi:hypothetical protein